MYGIDGISGNGGSSNEINKLLLTTIKNETFQYEATSLNSWMNRGFTCAIKTNKIQPTEIKLAVPTRLPWVGTDGTKIGCFFTSASSSLGKMDA